jgi:xylulokinase
VSYSQKDGLDIIEEIGVPVESVRISGGGANSPFWKQILADVFAKRVSTLASQEGSAYGAALLAMVGTGAFYSVQEACRATILEVESIQPRPVESKQYQKLHRVFQAIYPALKPIYGLIE